MRILVFLTIHFINRNFNNFLVLILKLSYLIEKCLVISYMYIGTSGVYLERAMLGVFLKDRIRNEEKNW